MLHVENTLHTSFGGQCLPGTWRAGEEENETLAFAHDDIVTPFSCALVSIHKGQDEILLSFIIDQVIISFVIPLHGTNIVNIEAHCEY
jgi:hypothetical protein